MESVGRQAVADPDVSKARGSTRRRRLGV